MSDQAVKARKPGALIFVVLLVNLFSLIFLLIAVDIILQLARTPSKFPAAILFIILVTAWVSGGVMLTRAINRRKPWALNVSRLYMGLAALIFLYGLIHERWNPSNPMGAYSKASLCGGALVLLFLLFFQPSVLLWFEPEEKPVSSTPPE
jgi:hypothetical protein